MVLHVQLRASARSQLPAQSIVRVQFSQTNAYLLLAAFPALIVAYMGISLNLRDSDGWRAMAAYLLWITVVQASTFMGWHAQRCIQMQITTLLRWCLPA